MKKQSLISGLLVAAMVIGVSVPAFAADSENKMEDMTPGYTDGIVTLNPANPQSGGFKMTTEQNVQIELPGDYIGETTVSITNNNPDILKIALVDDTTGSYAWNDDGTMAAISGTSFTRTSSTQYSTNDLEELAVSVPGSAQFAVYAAKAGTASLTLTYTPASGSYVGQSFTETVPFEFVSSSDNSNSGSSSEPSTPSVPSVPASSSSSTYKSDTGSKVSLGTGASYQFKITSLNGKKPTFVVPGKSFKVMAAGNKGKDYFFKVTAAGKDGDSAGVYINGAKTPSTVLEIKNTVTVDTGKNLKVQTGKTYQFKITSNTKPTFISGNSSVFKVTSNGHQGNNYYFKVKAVGKVGQGAGFYLNGSKTPTTVGVIG